MRTPKKILSALGGEDSFLIATHIDPDGDAIGSALALAEALQSMGKKAVLYDRDPVPAYLKFLPGHDKFTTNIKKALKSDPALILLDCNGPERAGIKQYEFRRSIIIDHHETESAFGDVSWIDKDAAATGLMVFSLIKALGVKFTKDTAVNLYTAITVDTGTFRYSNTSAEVLRACAELIESGVQPNLIAAHLYESWERNRFKLLIMNLSTLEIRDDIALTHVTKDMFGKTGTTAEDTENFSSFPRMIGSVKVVILLRELDKNLWKVSLRSRGDVNVAKVAEIFGGGGHKNAAGFTIKGGLNSAKEMLVETVKKMGL